MPIHGKDEWNVPRLRSLTTCDRWNASAQTRLFDMQWQTVGPRVDKISTPAMNISSLAWEEVSKCVPCVNRQGIGSRAFKQTRLVQILP